MKGRVLVIEDNAANLDLMTYLLQAFGHQVLVAHTGEEGLAVAADTRPDLILCDIGLPGLDGYGVARHLKADPVLGAVPLVAVTASAMVGDRDKVLAAGFDGYISKPIAAESFVAEVETYFKEAGR